MNKKASGEIRTLDLLLTIPSRAVLDYELYSEYEAAAIPD